ncbi:MAG: TIGR02757 family protein [Treponema sp.]|nr:TIGR02757 family protein [Treponema sp.]
MKKELDYWYEKTCTKEFIAQDPVQFPRRYKKREDIEIAAVLSATIAWGRRDMILHSAEKMFALTGSSPYDYVMSGGWKKLKKSARGADGKRSGNIHRTFFTDDLIYFCRGLHRCYVKYGNLENLFAGASDVWEGFFLFREEMTKAGRGAYSIHIANSGANNENGSACKKLNLALRWLVRKDKVDMGLWKKIKPADLYIPLDVHVARAARKHGLLKRNSNDKKAVIELTENLREFNPEDPVKYDFALFSMR